MRAKQFMTDHRELDSLFAKWQSHPVLTLAEQQAMVKSEGKKSGQDDKEESCQANTTT